MLYSLKEYDKTAPDNGTYNTAPPKFRKVEEKEICTSLLFYYNPELIEDRQFMIDGVFRKIKLFWFHDRTGVGIYSDYTNKKIIWYKFGCDHNFVELSQQECNKRDLMHFGSCYHVYECKECGYINAVDSSG